MKAPLSPAIDVTGGGQRVQQVRPVNAYCQWHFRQRHRALSLDRAGLTLGRRAALQAPLGTPQLRREPCPESGVLSLKIPHTFRSCLLLNSDLPILPHNLRRPSSLSDSHPLDMITIAAETNGFSASLVHPRPNPTSPTVGMSEDVGQVRCLQRRVPSVRTPEPSPSPTPRSSPILLFCLRGELFAKVGLAFLC